MVWLTRVLLRAAVSNCGIRPRGTIQCVGLLTRQYNASRLASDSGPPPEAAELAMKLPVIAVASLQRTCMPFGVRTFEELSDLMAFCEKNWPSAVLFSFSCLYLPSGPSRSIIARSAKI